MVKRLLECNANPNAIDLSGKTALAWCYEGKTEGVDDLLLKSGADVNVSAWQKHSVLYYVLASNKDEQFKNSVARKLIQNGATIKDMQVEYALNERFSKGIENQAEKLMRKQLINNLNSSDDKTASKFVSMENYLALYEYLISKKDYKNAKLIIQMGLSLDGRDKKTGTTRLMYAIKSNDLKYAKFLIDNKANINLKDNTGATATQIAIECGYTSFALELLKIGGKVYVDQAKYELLENAIIFKSRQPQSTRKDSIGKRNDDYYKS